MRKIAVFAIILICSFIKTSGTIHPQPTDDGNKFELSRFILTDGKIRHLTFDISNMIFNRKSGFKWPMTKIIFSKDKKNNDILRLDITALDNEWNKIIEPGEKPYGYFIINNRLFVISTKEDSPIDLTQYFDPIEDGERTFSDTKCKIQIKNPKWIYQCDNTSIFARKLQESNLEALGR
ncbi:hypothetical protein [Dysgonomonas sp.]